MAVTEEQRARRSKWVLVVRYVLFAAAGLLLLVYPIRVVLEAVAAAYTYTGGALLLAGSGMSAVGAAWDRWSGEALGLPLCCTAFALFGSVLCLTGSLAGIAIGLIFLGVAVGVADRWFHVMYFLRLAKREANGHAESSRGP